MSYSKTNGNKQSRVSLSEIDEMFKDAEFSQDIKDTFKKYSSTVRNDGPTQTTNMFYQKPTISQIMRLRAKGSHAGTRCPSLKKDEYDGRNEHHKKIPSEIENIPICVQYEQHREHEQLIQI